MSYRRLSQGRWTIFTMSYRRLTYSLGQWTNVTMSYRRLSHWDDGRMSPCLTEDFLTGTMEEFHHVLQKADLLTGMMDEFHHVLQKTYSLGRWANVTMSYTRLAHWDDSQISSCLTEDLLTGTMDEFHHVLQKIFSLG